MSWQDVRLIDVCELAIDCVNKTAPYVDYETQYKMLRTTNVRNGFVDINDARYVTKETYEKWTRRSKPKKGDVILTREAPLGDVGRLTSDDNVFLGQRLFLYRADPKVLDALYLAYVLQSPLVQGRFKSKGFGATVQHAKVGDCENLQIPLPKLLLQKKIGSLLANYDNLIENNRRRIQLLEESAHLLYKEWFVQLRFPGHEHVKVVDGVPEGWERGVIGSLADVKSGFAFKSKDWLKSGNPVIRIGNISGSGFITTDDCQHVDDSVAENAIKFELYTGDMLIAMTGATVGKVGLMPYSQKRHFLNQRVGKFFPKTEIDPIPYLFCVSRTAYFHQSVLNLAGGAAQPNISSKQLESIEILVPTKKLLEGFNENFSTAFKQRSNLLAQNTKLRLARDMLLPRLMNGTLAVLLT